MKEIVPIGVRVSDHSSSSNAKSNLSSCLHKSHAADRSSIINERFIPIYNDIEMEVDIDKEFISPKILTKW